MTTPTNVSRRRLLQLSLGGAAGLLASPALAADPTPVQPEGPFHPLGRVRGADGAIVTQDRRLLPYLDQDSDLTFVNDQPGTAIGTQLILTGVVRDENEVPLAGAEVEIWQACVSGRYNHRSDPNTEWLDPEFQYWGRATTGADGRYVFRTIVPGAYRASGSWIRPPHVHFKVGRLRFQELITQMYFEGVSFYYANRFYPAEVLTQLNLRDQILDGVPAPARPGVIAKGRPGRPGENVPDGLQVFEFDITLKAIQRGPDDRPIADDLTRLLPV